MHENDCNMMMATHTFDVMLLITDSITALVNFLQASAGRWKGKSSKPPLPGL